MSKVASEMLTLGGWVGLDWWAKVRAETRGRA